jgi:hypothetical protein
MLLVQLVVMEKVLFPLHDWVEIGIKEKTSSTSREKVGEAKNYTPIVECADAPYVMNINDERFLIVAENVEINTSR